MGAIRAHKTATDTESEWNGPAEVAKAPNEEATLRYMHAWVNDDGDPTAKSSYKFPHHAAGTDTPANINGVDNALARLSQADIPDGDRSGVENHLRAHRRDAGLEDKAQARGKRSISSKKTPIRCFEGKAQPYEPFWIWRNEAGSEPEMELDGYISEFSWWEDEITPKMFKDDLLKYGQGGPITIRIHSYGGDVIAASMMNTIIRDYPGRVTVQINGIAASAATVVAVAGDVVKIQDTAYFMIHDPLVIFFLAALNIEDLNRLASSLEAIKEGIVNAYEGKTGLSRTRLSKLMTDETWMDAQKAVDLGFVDEIITGEKKQLSIPVDNATMVNALSNFKKVPPEVIQALSQISPGNASGEPLLTDDEQREANNLREEIRSILNKEI